MSSNIPSTQKISGSVVTRSAGPSGTYYATLPRTIINQMGASIVKIEASSWTSGANCGGLLYSSNLSYLKALNSFDAREIAACSIPGFAAISSEVLAIFEATIPATTTNTNNDVNTAAMYTGGAPGVVSIRITSIMIR
jgi:hypothetical protein